VLLLLLLVWELTVYCSVVAAALLQLQVAYVAVSLLEHLQQGRQRDGSYRTRTAASDTHKLHEFPSKIDPDAHQNRWCICVL
jgi:hypothetical protein